MSRYRVLLRCVGEAVAANGLKCLLGMVPFGDKLFEIANDARERYQKQRQSEEELACVEAAAQAAMAEVKAEARQAFDEIRAAYPDLADPRAGQALVAYLEQVPASIRATFRRPADPSGRSVPRGFSLAKPEDFLRLLPPQPPRFRAGERVVGPWVLSDLLGVGGFGEVWKAVHSHEKRPIALKFCLDPTATRYLKHEAKLMERVAAQARVPGVVALEEVYLDHDPPCLAVEYVNGGDVCGLMHDWLRLPVEKRVPLAARVVLKVTRQDAERPPRPATRSPWLAAAVGVAGVVLLVSLALLSLLGRTKPEERADEPKEITASGEAEPPKLEVAKEQESPTKVKEIDAPRIKPPSKDGWTSLFDGKTLDGWRPSGEVGGWSVQDGQLVGDARAGRGWLLTNKDYSNFALSLSFLVGRSANSGVGFRGDRSTAAFAEIAILDEVGEANANAGNDKMTGALHGLTLTARGPVVNPGVWYSLEIEARGRQLTVHLGNSTTVATFLDCFVAKAKERNSPGVWRASGPIALQKWAGVVRFKDVRIKEFPPEEPAVPSPPPAPLPRPAAKAAPPAKPKLVPVIKVVFPGDVLLTTNEQEAKDIEKRFPGNFQGDKGHFVGRIGSAYAEQQPGTVLLRRYATKNRHVFSIRKIDDKRFKEEKGGGIWVLQNETKGASLRVGVRKADGSMEYGNKDIHSQLKKYGYGPTDLRFYLFD